MDLNDVKAAQQGKLIPLFPRRELTARPWVVKGVAMRGSVCALFGEPGSGKSLLSLHLAVAVASGRDWGPFEVREAGPVLMVNREDDVSEIDRRTWAISHVQPISEDCPVSLLDRPSVHLCERSPEGDLVRTEFFSELVGHIRENKARLVILDPLIELTGNLNENDNIEMNFMIEALRFIAQQEDCAVLFLHHTNKGGAGMNGMRGASAIAGRVRAANQFMHLPDGHGLDLIGPQRDYRVLTSAKQNYAPSAADNYFQAQGHLHEATDEWSPALLPVVLSPQLKAAEVAAWLDGKRHYERGGEAFYKEMAQHFRVKPNLAKQFVVQLLRDGALTTEVKYCETAKKSVPHLVCKVVDNIPF